MNKWITILIVVIVAIPIAWLMGKVLFPELDSDSTGPITATTLAKLTSPNPTAVLEVVERMDKQWHPGFATILLETLPLTQHPSVVTAMFDVLRKKSGQEFGTNMRAWHVWFWRQEYQPHPDYPKFKAHLYSIVDRRFADYFVDTSNAQVRLDEIVWGGVVRDGIPPLKDPKMLTVEEAKYLGDSNVVFGVEINGDARAYPKRILAWHEMVKDNVGGTSICGVYCTLCGSMIVYLTELDGKHYELGTSGFLYRSNKLMYDHETKSLWFTLTGEPVLGPLVGKQIKLNRGSVVTTTWGEWRTRHPHTTVLSLDTGHRRDYGEGEAYRDYFSTDILMFGVPTSDDRLRNKDEVLALRFDDQPDEQLAIAAEFLNKNPVYHDQVGDRSIVVITDASGANRVYDCGEKRFTSIDGNGQIVDSEGHTWILSETELTSPNGETLARLPAHRAFWFGWHAAYPQTRLVR